MWLNLLIIKPPKNNVNILTFASIVSLLRMPLYAPSIQPSPGINIVVKITVWSQILEFQSCLCHLLCRETTWPSRVFNLDSSTVPASLGMLGRVCVLLNWHLRTALDCYKAPYKYLLLQLFTHSLFYPINIFQGSTVCQVPGIVLNTEKINDIWSLSPRNSYSMAIGKRLANGLAVCNPRKLTAV